MVSRTDKARGAFRTIGEVSAETGLAHHILRYWETRFPQLRPVTRAGNRRYYRPEDVALVRRIDTLLNRQGYTIRGVQQLLADTDRAPPPAPADEQADLTAMLLAIRNRIAEALRQDDMLKPR
ncbi:MerR family transcriptional regulator [Sphingomonas sp. WKB10]|nr:MerR family transcriptional regulator [Sphingomonas sp. WKB10]